MGGGDPPGMLNVSHSHPLSGDSTVQANGGGRAIAAPRLDSLRYGACRIPSKAHVTGGTGARLRVDLRAALLPRLDLATSARGLARGCTVFEIGRASCRERV